MPDQGFVVERRPAAVTPAETPGLSGLLTLAVGVVVVAGLYLGRAVLIPDYFGGAAVVSARTAGQPVAACLPGTGHVGARRGASGTEHHHGGWRTDRYADRGVGAGTCRDTPIRSIPRSIPCRMSPLSRMNLLMRRMGQQLDQGAPSRPANSSEPKPVQVQIQQPEPQPAADRRTRHHADRRPAVDHRHCADRHPVCSAAAGRSARPPDPAVRLV